MIKLFGTDGIRGEVNKYPLTKEAVFKIGRALALWLKEQYPEQKESLKIIIGKDTRESGSELEIALSKGVQLEEVQTVSVGVCPTPVVSYLTVALAANLGIAISASHNPGSDNGIKFFNANGYKLFSSAEQRIEEIFFSDTTTHIKMPINLEKEQLQQQTQYLDHYIDFIKSYFNTFNLSHFQIVLDCAFGAFSKIAPKVFQDLGVCVYAINNEPDGKNINVNAGTLYPQLMSQQVLENRANIGIAFDGDGDRVILSDEKGNILDGDHILAILAKHFIEQQRLNNNVVICTQMSNIGLELYLQRHGIQLVRTEVGDKYVVQEMLKRQAILGGEQSGHIIILGRSPTGDGLIAALELIKVMLQTEKTLSELAKDLQKFPQVLKNVRVKEKRPLKEISGFSEAIKCVQTELGETGRILVRYSGTEKLARIMVEGSQNVLVERAANSVAKLIQESIGDNEIRG
jgi:phosphoglucosamine mutase